MFLNTDHSLTAFNIGVNLREEPVTRYDFKNTDWTDLEKICTETIDNWLEARLANWDVNEDYESYITFTLENRTDHT